MKTSILSFIFILGMVMSLAAQEKPSQDIREGSVLTINNPSSSSYQHIDFPRKNFIIKRGGIANMKALRGKKVQVVAFAYGSDGSTEVTLKPLDGGKFFRNFPTVTAHLEDALQSGELRQ